MSFRAVLPVSASGGDLVSIIDPTTGSRQAIVSDGGATIGSGNNFLGTNGIVRIWDGTNLVRQNASSAANLISQLGGNAALVSPPGMWSVVHAPAAATQATASKANVASTRHICTGFTASLCSTAAAAAQLTVNIRDGATGAGTILWTFDLAITATADSESIFGLTGLCLVGSVNTAMTIEFAAAGPANTLEKVSISGFDAT